MRVCKDCKDSTTLTPASFSLGCLANPHCFPYFIAKAKRAVWAALDSIRHNTPTKSRLL